MRKRFICVLSASLPPFREDAQTARASVGGRRVRSNFSPFPEVSLCTRFVGRTRSGGLAIGPRRMGRVGPGRGRTGGCRPAGAIDADGGSCPGSPTCDPETWKRTRLCNHRRGALPGEIGHRGPPSGSLPVMNVRATKLTFPCGRETIRRRISNFRFNCFFPNARDLSRPRRVT